MAPLDTGGPAFARPASASAKNYDDYVPGSVGLSLLDYFAAHAPTTIPGWFEPELPDVLPEMPSYVYPDHANDPDYSFENGVNNYFQHLAPDDRVGAEQDLNKLQHRGWWRPGAYAGIKEWLALRAAAADARDAWQVRYDREHLAQWPYYWARLQLAERTRLGDA